MEGAKARTTLTPKVEAKSRDTVRLSEWAEP